MAELELVAVARVVGSFGVSGALRLMTYSGEWDHLRSVESFLARFKGQERSLTVSAFEVRGDTLLLHAAGIDDPESARRLSGWELWVPAAFAAPRHPGEHYIRDLHGADIELNGSHVGVVSAVIEGAQAELLEVTLAETGRTVLIPFLEQFVEEPQYGGGRVRIELQAPWVIE